MQFKREYRDCIKSRSDKDWDHKAYHDAPSAIIIIMCMSPSSLGNCTIYSTWCIMICPILSHLLFIQSLSKLPFIGLSSFFLLLSLDIAPTIIIILVK